MKLTPLLLLAFAAAGSLFAGPDTVTTTTSSKTPDDVTPSDQSVFDQIWAVPKLYKNDANPFIEEFNLIGRFQFDYFHISSDKGDKDFSEIRRFRLGEDAFFAERHLELKAEVDTALDTPGKPHDFYNRMTNMYAQFHLNDEFNVRVGKWEPHFGYDREFSDNYQKFFERSAFDDQVFNKTGNDYVSQAAVMGKIGNWGYQATVYSTAVNQEFGDFNGGIAYMGELSYDFSKQMGITAKSDKALWAVDYMHVSDATNPNSTVFNTSKNDVATYFDYQKGQFCFVTQFGYLNGIASKGDVYEGMVMPSFYIVPEKLEFLVRYTYLHGSEANSISTINHDESTVGGFTGNNESDVYVGLNYYLYGMKLRFMAGEEYTDLTGGTGSKAGFKGWVSIVGFRMFFD